MGKSFVLIICFFTLVSCKKTKKLFEFIPIERSGIEFSNELNPTIDLNILTYLYYYNGAGVASADFNNDGLEDLYFVSNQAADKLYLNKGDLTFEDITKPAGINNDTGWSFGVTATDINSDGFIDIYISKVGNYKGIKGRNLLYINQGVNTNGVPSFIEAGPKHGLDISAFCTQTAFFDYDLDGDLDAYVLNHSVHPNSNYGLGEIRKKTDSLSGDMLLRNDNEYFVDVSVESGIYQGAIGYGLDLSIGDLNGDLFPDIYVGNDFFENDYLYINQGDGTFEDLINKKNNPLGHTTHFSMGNAFADLNNDGMQDIISLDMLPQDLVSYKTSGTEYPYSIYHQYLRKGYSPQFMQNTVHLNHAGGFSEAAFQLGISATEWSWAILANDFDLDGYKDLYITNGIPAATNDMDYVKFASEELIQKQLMNPSVDNFEVADKIPSKYVRNYGFKNLGTTFLDVSEDWFEEKNSYSSGAVAVDLDNDGDLDIVTNNINQPAFVYENKSLSGYVNYLKIAYVGDGDNKLGVGAKIRIHAGSLVIREENFPNRTYLSSSPLNHTIGLGTNTRVDSLIVIWPNGSIQKRYNINSNQSIILSLKDADQIYDADSENDSFFELNDKELIRFSHLDQTVLDFDRDPLIPFAKSNEGPSISVGDINMDGFDDLFLGGGKGQRSKIFFGDSDGLYEPDVWQLDENLIYEVTASHLFDADNDGDLDLLVGYGGNEFVSGEAIQPCIYFNDNGWTQGKKFQEIEQHVSSIKSFDIDKDGDLDLIITSNTVTGQFGKNGKNYILKNENGTFKDVTNLSAPEFMNYGLIEDVKVLDFDKNGYDDILVAGYWIPITIFLNDGEIFKPKIILPNSEGWWNTIEAADFDNDGDTDLVAGNWGLNTRLRASKEEPITLYRYDFDENEKVDPIISYYHQGEETTLASKDELSKQLPYLNKKYLSYLSFAKASFGELFGPEKLKKASKKRVYNLSSTYFENVENGIFVPQMLPFEAQMSSVQDIMLDDIDEDGFVDMVLVGNSYELSTQLGRLDALHGLVMLNDRKGSFYTGEHLNITGAARKMERITINNDEYLLIGLNNDKPVILKRSKNK